MTRFQTTSGNYHAIGSATGALMGPWLRKLVAAYPAYYRRLGFDYVRLRARAQKFLPASRSAFPKVIEECRSIARAAKISFADFWFMIVEEEIAGELAWQKNQGHCTSVLLATKQDLALVHNEDYDGRFRGMVAVQEIHPSRGVPFVRFIYPLSMPGSTAMINAAGIAFSEDSLFFPVNPKGVTKNVILRALAGARSLPEVVGIMRKTTPTLGFTLNVVSKKERKAIAIERSPHGLSVVPVRKVLVHTNHILDPQHSGDGELGTRHHSNERLNEVAGSLRRDASLEAAQKALAQTGAVRSAYRSQSGHMTIATIAADLHQNKFGIKVWGPRRPVWEWFSIPTL